MNPKDLWVRENRPLKGRATSQHQALAWPKGWEHSDFVLDMRFPTKNESQRWFGMDDGDYALFKSNPVKVYRNMLGTDRLHDKAIYIDESVFRRHATEALKFFFKLEDNQALLEYTATLDAIKYIESSNRAFYIEGGKVVPFYTKNAWGKPRYCSSGSLAMGLMQIQSDTDCFGGEQSEAKEKWRRLQWDPIFNIWVGVEAFARKHHLTELADRFDNLQRVSVVYYHGWYYQSETEAFKKDTYYKRWQKYYDQMINGYHVPGVGALPMKLKRGYKGNTVKKMQEALIEKGYDLGRWGADGDFGRATEYAVKAFQKDYGMTVNGIFDDAAAEVLYGMDELTKATIAIQHHLIKENYEVEAHGKYDLKTALALVKSLGIELEEEPMKPPPLVTTYPKTAHFALEDFEEMAPIPEEYYPLVQAEMEALEHIYDYLDEGEEVVIHHGYRTQAWQDRRYPDKQSMHLYGGAADISIDGYRGKDGIHRIGVIAKELYDQGVFGGVGLGNRCVHVDIRHLELADYPNNRAMWFYDGYENYIAWYDATK